jgi:hypothetical protein
MGDPTGTLVETWNGTVWTVVPSPSKGTFTGLDGVSCVSARACTAVGAFQRSQTVSKTLIESWNGTVWKIVPSPNRPQVRPFDQLNSVSCVSARACTAVGFRGNKTLVESWNGAAWTIVPSPNPRGVSGLAAVSCLSTSDCTAVGTGTGSGPPGSPGASNLIESWNGTAWTVVPSPNKGIAEAFDGLDGVSCVSARDCTAVGSFFSLRHDHVTPTKTLVESWNGTAWTIVPSPSKAGTSINALFGVSCPSTATCTAVGNYGGNASRKTLIELGTAVG